MHHTLPFPAPEMKCVLALADEEGRRGATLQGKAAKANSEGRLRRCPPAAWSPSTACVSRGVGLPGRQSPQPKSMWGRGGSKDNDMKIHPLRKKAR